MREKRWLFCELFNVDFPLTVDCIVEVRGEQVISLSKDVDSNRKSSQKRRKTICLKNYSAQSQSVEWN